MHIKQQGNFAYGYNSITEMNGKHSDMLMDFGVLKMKDGDTWVSEDQELERAFLLVTGHVTLEWEGNKKEIKRENCFDENPICLHVAKQVKVSITAHGESEIVVQKTDNENTFESKLYDDCLSERFGAGTMQETSTRTVRTIFDARTAPYSNLVVGEVINHPGKWSSYPPHHHPQPEIYYYKFLPEKGYGHSEEGDNVYKVTNSDTVTITPGLVHSQCAAPGYAMFYVWMIRNLRDNPFGPRIFLPEHEWVAEKDAKIWPDK